MVQRGTGGRRPGLGLGDPWGTGGWASMTHAGHPPVAAIADGHSHGHTVTKHAGRQSEQILLQAGLCLPHGWCMG